MIHTKKSLTLEQLARVRLVEPKDAGGLWQGVQHAELLRAFAAAIVARGWNYTAAKLSAALSKDKADMVASWPVHELGIELPAGYRVELGIKNSNARRFALSIFVGVRSADWETSFVVEEFVVGRKREGRFNLENRLAAALESCAECIAKIPAVVARLQKSSRIDDNEFRRLLCRVGDDKILPWSRVGDVHHFFLESEKRTALEFLLCVCTQVDRAPVVAREGQMELRLKAFGLLCDEGRCCLV